MNDLRKRIYLLAQGPASYVVREMQQSKEEVDQVCELFPSMKEMFLPDAKAAKQKISEAVSSVESYVSPLESGERDIRTLESKPGLKRYYNLQDKIQSDITPSFRIPDLQREAQGLKAAFSRELATIVKKSQEVLVLRLNLIEAWKDIVTIEIEFMEELQQDTLSRLLKEAHRGGHADLVKHIQERLSFLQCQSVLQSTHVKPSTLQFGNIKTLKESLRNQIKEAIQLERIMMQKYETLHELSSIGYQINNEISEEPVYALKYQQAAQNTPNQPAAPSKPARMAFSRLQPRTV